MKNGYLDGKMIKRGTLWSRRMVHDRVRVPDFEDGATLPIRVPCRDASGRGLNPDDYIRFAIAIALEVAGMARYDVGCPYVRKGRSGGDIDREACDLRARKNEKRSDRIEREHVVPASWFGSDRAFWREGHDLCKKKGRRCCLRPGVGPDFVAAHNDPHNLFASGGEVNGDRLNHPYGVVEGEPRSYGSCDFDVGGSAKRAEPADAVRGEVVRAMLYMAERYGVDVRMSREELLAWSAADPAAAWERERALRIEAATGLNNPYIGIP